MFKLFQKDIGNAKLARNIADLMYSLNNTLKRVSKNDATFSHTVFSGVIKID